MGAYEVLQSGQWYEETRTFAVLDDADYVPVVVEKIIGVAYFDIFALAAQSSTSRSLGPSIVTLDETKLPTTRKLSGSMP